MASRTRPMPRISSWRYGETPPRERASRRQRCGNASVERLLWFCRTTFGGHCSMAAKSGTRARDAEPMIDSIACAALTAGYSVILEGIFNSRLALTKRSDANKAGRSALCWETQRSASATTVGNPSPPPMNTVLKQLNQQKTLSPRSSATSLLERARKERLPRQFARTPGTHARDQTS